MCKQLEESFRSCVNYAYEMLVSSVDGFSMSDFWGLVGKITDAPEDIIKRLDFLGLSEVRKDRILPRLGDNDISPRSFPRFKGRYYYYPECSSTMDEAAKLASEGVPDFTVVIAESQDSGRGRNGRQWVSAPGGIYCSIILRPDVEPELCFRINFMVSAVLSSFLRDAYGIDAACKWPNDILAGGGKLAGMISDSVFEGSKIKYMVIGLGINVNNVLSEVGQPVSSMRNILGNEVSRRNFFDGFLLRLEKAYPKLSSTDWIAETRKFSATIGRKVTIERPMGAVSGEAIGVDNEGLLLVSLDNSKVIRVSSGDCVQSYI